MLKNSFIFLVCFFLVVLTNAVPFHHGCMSSVEEEEQLLMTFPEDTLHNSLTTISDCGNADDILQIMYINLTPDPPQKGQQLNIRALGFLNERVEQGSYINVSVKLGVIKLLTRRFDLCEESAKVDKPCPIERGRQELNTAVDLPAKIPPGKYLVDALVYTADNRRIACLKAVAIFRP